MPAIVEKRESHRNIHIILRVAISSTIKRRKIQNVFKRKILTYSFLQSNKLKWILFYKLNDRNILLKWIELRLIYHGSMCRNCAL